MLFLVHIWGCCMTPCKLWAARTDDPAIWIYFWDRIWTAQSSANRRQAPLFWHFTLLYVNSMMDHPGFKPIDACGPWCQIWTRNSIYKYLSSIYKTFDSNKVEMQTNFTKFRFGGRVGRELDLYNAIHGFESSRIPFFLFLPFCRLIENSWGPQKPWVPRIHGFELRRPSLANLLLRAIAVRKGGEGVGGWVAPWRTYSIGCMASLFVQHVEKQNLENSTCPSKLPFQYVCCLSNSNIYFARVQHSEKVGIPYFSLCSHCEKQSLL